MDQINSEILRQFEKQGLTINEGVAIDARLVKSANRPVSNKKLRELKEKNNSPEGKLDKTGKPKKFSRDLDSDWVVQKDIPHYGLKEHAAVDTNHGFILATTITPSSVNDTNLLQYCTAFSRHTKQKIEKVYPVKYVQRTFASQFHRTGANKGYLPSGISLREPAEGGIQPGEENPIETSWLEIKLQTVS